MNSFIDELSSRLAARREQDLYRELRRIDSAQSTHIQWRGQTFINFSSNDYLGLATYPALREAAIKAVERYGSGSGASRLICGSLAPFHELEEALAEFKRTQAALTFATGYAAAQGSICSLMGKDDVIIADKLIHACLVDAMRLSGAKLRIFRHNDLDDLTDKLKWAEKSAVKEGRKSRTLIITESVFSMDGDHAPLRQIVALKEKYGAWLMVDEAHATGVLGRNGRGLADELGMGGAIEIQMGTLGKAFGASGGYICGSRVLIDFLVNHARSFIFSTAPVPAAAAAAAAGIKLAGSPEGEVRRRRLFTVIQELETKLTGSAARPISAIIPLMIGDEGAAKKAAARLNDHRIFVPAIRYPTVARGAARLRITATAGHSNQDVEILMEALKTIGLKEASPAS